MTKKRMIQEDNEELLSMAFTPEEGYEKELMESAIAASRPKGMYDIEDLDLEHDDSDLIYKMPLYMVEPDRTKTQHTKLIRNLSPEEMVFREKGLKRCFCILYYYDTLEHMNQKISRPSIPFWTNFLPGSNPEFYNIPCGVPLCMPYWIFVYLKQQSETIVPLPVNKNYQVDEQNVMNVIDEIQKTKGVEFVQGKNRLVSISIPKKYHQGLLEEYRLRMERTKLDRQVKVG